MKPSENVVLPEDLKRRLAEDCRRRLPHETCGVLFGQISASSLCVQGYSLVRNASADPGAAFLFEPGDWIRTYYEAQKNRRNIVGFFHSHPNGSPEPSFRDLEDRLPWGIYLIVAFIRQDVIFQFYR